MAIATSLEFGARIRRTTPTNDPDVSTLGRFALFSGAPTPVLAALGAASTIRHLPRRGVLLSEGSVASHVFLVIKGRIRAIRRSASGREVTVETYRAGDLLADAVLAPDRPLPNEWEASEPSDVTPTSVYAPVLFRTSNGPPESPELMLEVLPAPLAQIEVGAYEGGSKNTDAPQAVSGITT